MAQLKIVGLDGREHSIDVAKYLTNIRAPTRKMSNPMKRAIALVTRLMPSDPICTEMYLPGASCRLWVDIYLPLRSLAIEVDGAQHFKYNSLFHKDKQLLYRTQARDREKTQLLESNGITLVRLSDADNDSKWIHMIRQALIGDNNES